MAVGGELLTSALAGLAFIGCAMTNAAGSLAAGAGQGRRREVVVNGKRVKTVDIHAHCIVPEAAAVINHPLEAPGLLMADTSARIAAMDAQGIDVEALSINPYWYRAEREAAAELIRVQNETLVEFCAANPDRFVAFATASLQHPDLAAEQLEHAVKKLGFRGVGVGGSVAGDELANPRFHTFWAKCEELGVLVDQVGDAPEDLGPLVVGLAGPHPGLGGGLRAGDRGVDRFGAAVGELADLFLGGGIEDRDDVTGTGTFTDLIQYRLHRHGSPLLASLRIRGTVRIY